MNSIGSRKLQEKVHSQGADNSIGINKIPSARERGRGGLASKNYFILLNAVSMDWYILLFHDKLSVSLQCNLLKAY